MRNSWLLATTLWALTPAALADGTAGGTAGRDTPAGTVEELPVENFDAYPDGEFPPHPWKRIGGEVAGVTLKLNAQHETPFVGNKVHGKSLVCDDQSTGQGKGVGAEFNFAAPPPGQLYVGFDFSFAGEATAFDCELGAGPAKLSFRIGPSGTLSYHGQELFNGLEAEVWYRLAVDFTGDVARARLFDIRNANINVYSLTMRKEAVKTFTLQTPPARYNRLAFVNATTAPGTWRVDNVLMAGDVAAPRGHYFPFDKLPTSQLRATRRKVFAYNYIYTPPLDPTDPGVGWYIRGVGNPTNLTHGDRRGAGTELLNAPLPRPPLPADTDKDAARRAKAREDVRLAIAEGLDGFHADFHAYPNVKSGQSHFNSYSFLLMDAADEIDPGFKILPGIYNSRSPNANPAEKQRCSPQEYAASPIFEQLWAHPATLRTPDGEKMIISMWMSENETPQWWRETLAEMARLGRPAVLLGYFNTDTNFAEFAELCYGMARWGQRFPLPFTWLKAARQATKLLVAPVAMQDVRTRGAYLWEAGNFDLLRFNWQEARDEQADWAFLITWSDYSETPLAPSTFIGFAPYDLNAYYSQWFKTGQEPTIVRDTLYYSYRRQHTDAPQRHGEKWKFSNAQSAPARNEIELLAFLQAPGTLTIEVDGQTHTKEAPAGVSSFKVPLPLSKRTFTPRFGLSRDGAQLIDRAGRYAILPEVEYPHLLYCTGVLTRSVP